MFFIFLIVSTPITLKTFIIYCKTPDPLHPLRFLPSALQNTTAAAVLINVATIAGAITAVGFTLPYCCLYTIILTGISCREEIFKIRKSHISFEAVRSFFTLSDRYSGFPLSASSLANSSIAFNPAGVQAQPSPKIFAIRFVEIYPLAGWSRGMFGNRKVMNGEIPLVIFAISPDFCAISIRPTHNDITPIIVIHKDTASPAESSAAFDTASIFPLKAPNTIPIKIINAQI